MGDHERAGAGDDQQDKRPVQPFVERPVPGQRRDDRHQRRDEHHGGRVVAGEAGDEAFDGGLVRGSLLDELKDAGHGRVGEKGGHFHGYRCPSKVDASRRRPACPRPRDTGTDSPVRGDVSTCEEPVRTVPSSGIFSPGFTRMRIPGLISAGSASFTICLPSFSSTRCATVGRAASSARMERRELPAAQSCKASPME